jgi:hypothetical protein
MISRAEAMRAGLPKSCSHGSICPGMRRFETENPHRPAFGFAPRPVAPSSRISPPEPVAAPGNGDIAVGWLWVSTFISVWVGSSAYPKRPSAPAKKRRVTRPSMIAALSA